MNTYLLILNLCLFVAFGSGNLIDIANSKLDTLIRRDLRFLELAKFDGYEVDNHTVTTIDGYVLEMFRVKPRCPQKGLPIIFMHGLYLSADDCITPGPGVAAAHCYNLADDCREIWAPNNRGNLYGRKHVSLNPDRNPKFWDFAFEEMAYYDTPAIIDYVLNATGAKQVYWIAHSQGVTNLLLLCAKRPEYNQKIKAGFGLSATAWVTHARFVVLKIEDFLSPLLTTLNNAGVNMEFLPRDGPYQPLAKLLCGTSDTTYLGCSALYFAVLGYDSFQITDDVFKVLTGHLPSGTSLKDFNRWGQIKKNGFTEYDYGLIGNLKNYNQVSPPEFDLSNVTMKWIMIGSENDYVADLRDVNKLITKLKDAELCVLSDKRFGHLDFLFGKDVPNLITPGILKFIDTGAFECL